MVVKRSLLNLGSNPAPSVKMQLLYPDSMKLFVTLGAPLTSEIHTRGFYEGMTKKINLALYSKCLLEVRDIGKEN